MKYILSILVLIFLTNSISGQNKFSIVDLSNIVVSIGDLKDKKINIVGTGTIINDNNRYWILTASHVIDSIKGSCIIIFRIDNDKPYSLPLSFFQKNNNSWKKHIEADISVIEIFPFDKASSDRLKKWSFPKNQILLNKEAISRDFNVVVLGFPILDQIGEHFSPLSFKSYFSSGLISLKRADTHTLANFQLLENPSVQGYSGGPVLISVSQAGAVVGPDNTMLVGIVHGTYSDNTGGKIAMITVSYYISDLLK